MAILLTQNISSKKTLRKFIPIALIAGMIAIPCVVWAAGSITISPSTGLTNGQKVTVSGTGMHTSTIGSIVECNNDPSQPTVVTEGNAVPVSCSNPLTTLISTDKNGKLPATSFVVHTGTIGPPSSGKDSAGNSASADAAKYPCPPTAAQIAAGISCSLTYGDANGDDVIQNITFASQTTTTPTPTPTPTTTTPSPTTSTTTTPTSTTTTTSTTTPSATTPAASTPNATTPTSSNLTNTGPGDIIALFVGTVIVTSLMHYYFASRNKKASNKI